MSDTSYTETRCSTIPPLLSFSTLRLSPALGFLPMDVDECDSLHSTNIHLTCRRKEEVSQPNPRHHQASRCFSRSISLSSPRLCMRTRTHTHTSPFFVVEIRYNPLSEPESLESNEPRRPNRESWCSAASNRKRHMWLVQRGAKLRRRKGVKVHTSTSRMHYYILVRAVAEVDGKLGCQGVARKSLNSHLR